MCSLSVVTVQGVSWAADSERRMDGAVCLSSRLAVAEAHMKWHEPDQPFFGSHLTACQCLWTSHTPPQPHPTPHQYTPAQTRGRVKKLSNGPSESSSSTPDAIP